MSDWIEWNGGECPVYKGTLLDVRHKDGEEFIGVAASIHYACEDWKHICDEGDIVAYRIHNAGIEKSDPVNFPSHYRQGEIECIDAIKSALTPEEFRGYCKGNAIKYAWREKHKGGDESLKKAVWYLNKAAE